MRNETIRALDAIVGSVLCGLLTVHRRLFESAADRQAARAPSRRILFLKLIEQGATVVAHDAVQRATARVGRDNVFFCVFAENREIIDVMDLVRPENVFVLRSAPLGAFAVDAWRTIRSVRRAAIDTVVDMEFFARAPAALAYLMGARRRVGLHRFNEEAPYRGDLMTHRVLHNPFLHAARAYRLLVDALDADPDDLPLAKIPVPEPLQPLPRLLVEPAQRQRVQALLDEAAGRPVERPIVLLNPNCRDALPLRRWPTERFVELGRRILADHAAVTLVVTGAPPERAAAEAVCRGIGSQVVNLAGRTTLRDILVLYDLADVLVTNDSGPGHFASLTPIDSIVMFGPGAPIHFGPIGGRPHVLWAGLACSPCVNVYNHRLSSCTNNVCMQAITVDEVYARVAAALGSRAARQSAPQADLAG